MTEIQINIKKLNILLESIKVEKNTIDIYSISSSVCKTYLENFYKTNKSIKLKKIIAIICEDSNKLKKKNENLKIVKLLDITICCLMIKLTDKNKELIQFVIDIKDKANNILNELINDL